MVPRYVFDFYLVKNHKIAKNSTTTKAGGQNKNIFVNLDLF
jgi:hypothetical protein